MSTTFENKVIVQARLTTELLGIEQFAVERTCNNSDALNNPNRPKQPLRCDDFGRQNYTMQLPPTHDGKIYSFQEVNLAEKSPATNTKNCQSGTFQSKENFKRKRGQAVKSISEWIFPPGTKNKHSFVISSLRLGADPQVAFQQHDKQLEDIACTSPSLSSRKYRVGINRKRRLQERDDDSKTMVHPIVTGARFDKRFLRYKLSSGGERKEEILVRSLSVRTIPIRNYSQTKEAWEKGYIEIVPDEPPRTETSSRIGPRYQARIPSKSTCADTVDKFSPGFIMLWDPKLAEEAERRGEDISGFLEGDQELCKQDLLFSILHKNDYKVAAARMDLEKMQRQDNAFSSSKLNEDEAKHFETLIRKKQKNISVVAKILNRKRSDCLVHYYTWKKTSRRYKSMKKRWSNKYCSVCSDGGFLIVCDGCSSNFHLKCAEPPLTAVPDGNWFCDSCRCIKRTAPSICTGKSLLSNTESTSYDCVLV